MGLVLLMIIAVIVTSVGLYGLGYSTAKIHSLEKFKVVMDKMHDEALSVDLTNEYNRGHSYGMLDAIDMIQDGDIF